MTICPYKIVMIGITVLLGALVAYGQIHNDDEEEQTKKAAEALAYLKKFDGDVNGDSEEDSDDEEEGEGGGTRKKEKTLAKLAASKAAPKEERWGDMAATYVKGLHSGAKAAHPRAYRAAYLTMVSLLVLFHFEIFSGGRICRFLFHNASAAAADNASVAAADAAMGIVPAGDAPLVG